MIDCLYKGSDIKFALLILENFGFQGSSYTWWSTSMQLAKWFAINFGTASCLSPTILWLLRNHVDALWPFSYFFRTSKSIFVIHMSPLNTPFALNLLGIDSLLLLYLPLFSNSYAFFVLLASSSVLSSFGNFVNS